MIKIPLIILCLFFSTISCAQDESMPAEILKHINAYRIKHHMQPLTMNSNMSKEAQIHSRDMATHKMSFGHQGFQKRIQNCFKPFHKKTGPGAENVAYNYKNASIVVSEWLKSPGHLANIRGNYNLTGIGVARDKKGKIYFTQLFMRI